MTQRKINAEDGPESFGGYPQALEVSGTTRRLYISGQVPIARDCTVPERFEDQAKQTWANVIAQLTASGMTTENLVKATIFLSHRKFALANRQARIDALGDHCPSLSVVIAEIFDEAWLLEIEAIAEA